MEIFMSDVYQTPESNLMQQSDYNDSEYGSIEDAITGNYKFEVGEVISEAWGKTKGFKRIFILALILIIVTQMVVMLVTGIIFNAILDLGIAGALIQQLLLLLVIMPIQMGVFLLGIKRSVNADVNVTSIFNHFDKTLKIFLTMLLMWIILTIGFLLFIIPGIYLSIAYFMAMPLVVEKDMGIWEAMETSRKAITKRWFTMFLYCIVMSIIMFISMIPLGIGLIWTLPMAMIGYAIIYRNMFGINSETLGGDASESYVEADPIVR